MNFINKLKSHVNCYAVMIYTPPRRIFCVLFFMCFGILLFAKGAHENQLTSEEEEMYQAQVVHFQVQVQKISEEEAKALAQAQIQKSQVVAESKTIAQTEQVPKIEADSPKSALQAQKSAWNLFRNSAFDNSLLESKETLLKVFGGAEAGSARYNPSLNIENKTITVKFKMYGVNIKDAKGGFKFFATNSFNSVNEVYRVKWDNATLKLASSGTLTAEGGIGSATYTNFGLIPEKEWVDIAFVIKVVQDGTITSDVYVNGENKGANVANIKKAPLLNYFAFITDSNTGGEFYIDEFYIEDGDTSNKISLPVAPVVLPVAVKSAGSETARPKDENYPPIPSPKQFSAINPYGAGLNGYSVLRPEKPVKTVSVLEFGAKANDASFNNAPAFKAAIEKSESGTEILIPNGTYYFISNDSVIVNLKTGVSMRGESQKGTVLKAVITEPDSVKAHAFFRSNGASNFSISNFTVTAAFFGEYITDSTINNPKRGNLTYGFSIDYNNSGGGSQSNTILFENVTIENFSRIAIVLRNTHDVTIRKCTFQNATDVGGGGAGYGISVQGAAYRDDLGAPYDSRHNLIEENVILGPYIRHAILLQYFSHNNLVINNYMYKTVLGSIDLHGEDEYLNEVAYNTVYNTTGGGGLEVGNSGAGHAAGGALNYFHDNTVIGAKRGMDIVFGTPDTIVENNVFENSGDVGIIFGNSLRSIVRNNTITGSLATAIRLQEGKGYSWNGNSQFGAGIPVQNEIYENILKNNKTDFDVTSGKENVIVRNSADYKGSPSFVTATSANALAIAINAASEKNERIFFTRPFLPTRKEYRMYVQSASVAFSVIPHSNFAQQITVQGQTVQAQKAHTVSELKIGENSIKITITAQDGKTQETYTVTVIRVADGEKMPIPIQNVQFVGQTNMVIPQDMELPLKYNVFPLNTTFKNVEWVVLSGAQNVSVNANGILIGKAQGEAKIRLISKEDPSLYKDFTVAVGTPLKNKPVLDSKAVLKTIVSVLDSGNDGNEAENSIDGNDSTRWASATEVEKTTNKPINPSWIIWEIEDSAEITHVNVAWFNGYLRKTEFKLYVSQDGVTWNKVPDWEGRASGLTASLESFVLKKPVRGKYVKLEGFGNYANGTDRYNVWNSITNAEIWGK